MRAKSFRAEEDSKLQGHVEPGQMVRLICDFRARDIVNAVITLRDQSIDILDANFARVSQFERASRHESACDNAKRDRFEERLVRLIERAVDEHASAWGTLAFRFSCVETLAGQVCPNWTEFFPYTDRGETVSILLIS